MSTKTGLSGEFVVCSAIINLEGDLKVVHTPQDRIDVLAFEEMTFLRVSVKTSRIITDKDGRRPTYHFQNGSGSKKKSLPLISEIDIVAHCFLDHRRVAFYAAETVQQYSQRRPVSFATTPRLEQDTWDRAMQIVQERVK